MQLRPARIDDIPQLLPLIKSYWDFEGIQGFDPTILKAKLEHLLSTPTLGNGWLVEVASKAVAYLLVVYVFSLEHKGLTTEIDEFFVAQVHRNSGIGRALLHAAEAESAVRGCGNIALQLSRNNPAARDFYMRQGYGTRSGFELLEKNLITEGARGGYPVDTKV